MADAPTLTADGPMAPEESPGGKNFGIRRVNNLPVYIVGAILIAFFLVVAVVAFQRAQGQRAKAAAADAPQQRADDVGRTADSIVPASTGPIAPVRAPTPATDPLTSLPPDSGVSPVDPAAPPVALPPPTPPATASSTPPSGPRPLSPAQEARRQREAARLALFEQAVTSPLRVRQTGGATLAASGAGSADLAAAGQQLEAAQQQGDITADAARAQLAAFQRDLGGGGSGGMTEGAGIGADVGNSINRFAGPGSGAAVDRWRLNQQVQAPRSPYELRAGFVIPATLISGVNSELPGQIVAQVSQNVWDTPTGRNLLVPQGSRLVGTYSSSVVYGQRRVLVAWQRIVFPDGKALDIGAMPGADAAGFSGFRDKVQTHFFRVLSQAVLLSGITAGITYSQRQNDASNQFGRVDAGSILSAALGQQLGQVTAELIRKNLNVSPTLIVRPGFRFNVVVTKDLTFTKPYQPFDY